MNTHKLSLQNGEFLSALADGELRREELPALFDACEDDVTASERWNAYHRIGEALRSPGSTVQSADFAFLARLNQQLMNEPSFGTVPQVSTPHSSLDSTPIPIVNAGERRGPAANESTFRWKMVAGFACAVAVSAMAWSVNGLMLPAAGPQLAQAETAAESATAQQVVVASPQGLMVRDARLEELVAAHKQLGATSALPVPSGFLRNAIFETQQSLGR
jgi:sigma-E factor negative regulatory protein RseA